MPVSTGIVQNPSLWQKLTRAFQVKGQHVTPELGAVIHPVCLIEDLTRGSRYEILERPCGAGGVAAPVAAQFSQQILVNPSNSGVLCLVERIVVDVGIANSQFGLAFIQVALGLANAFFLDRRLQGVPACGPNQRSVAAQNLEWYVSNVPGPIADLPPVVLVPGEHLAVQGDVVNMAVRASFQWREIPLTA